MTRKQFIKWYLKLTECTVEDLFDKFIEEEVKCYADEHPEFDPNSKNVKILIDEERANCIKYYLDNAKDEAAELYDYYDPEEHNGASRKKWTDNFNFGSVNDVNSVRYSLRDAIVDDVCGIDFSKC